MLTLEPLGHVVGQDCRRTGTNDIAGRSRDRGFRHVGSLRATWRADSTSFITTHQSDGMKLELQDVDVLRRPTLDRMIATRLERQGPASLVAGWRSWAAFFRKLFRAEEAARGLPWVLMPALLVAASVIIMLGRVGSHASNTMWGEDGAVFLQGEHDSGYWHTVLLGYDGYLHLAPRTIAWVASTFPLRDWAIAVSVTCAVVIGLVAAFVSRALSAYGLARPIATVSGLLVPLAPIGLYECADVAANIQWYLACGAFWALLWAPRERRWIAAGAVLALITAGSAPLTLTLLPLAVLRLLVTGARDRIVPVAYLAGAGLTIFTMQHSRRQGILKPPGIEAFLRAFGERLIAAGWFGPKAAIVSLDGIGDWTVALACLVWICLFAACRRSPLAVLILAVGVVEGVALYAAGAYFNYAPVQDATGQHVNLFLTGRYVNSPSVIFVSTSLVALLIAQDHSRLLKTTLGAFIAGVSIVAVTSFHYGAPRQAGPSWNQALATARKTCAAHPSGSAMLSVAPVSNFDLVLSCSEISDSR